MSSTIHLRRHPLAAAVAALALAAARPAAAGDFSALAGFGPSSNGLSSVVSLGGTTDSAQEAAVGRSSGDLYVFAYKNASNNSPPGAYEVVRYTSAGLLDSSFGANGVLKLQLTPSSISGSLNSMAVDEAHSLIYLAGSNATNLILYRFGFTGSIDGSFGTSGVLSFAAPGGAPNVGGVRLQPSGIYMGIVGTDGPGVNSNGKAAKAMIASVGTGSPAGTGQAGLNTGFGSGGFFEQQLTASPACDNFEYTQQDSSGNVYLAGSSQPISSSNSCGNTTSGNVVAIAKISSAGVLQSGSFAASSAVPGVFIFNPGGSGFNGTGPLRLEGNGELGFVYPISVGSGSINVGVSELLADGSALDGSFGNGGSKTGSVAPPGGFSVNGGVTLDDAGHVLLAGNYSSGGNPQVAAYAVNGDPILQASSSSGSGGSSSSGSSSSSSSGGGSSSGSSSSSSSSGSSTSSSSSGSGSSSGSSSGGGGAVELFTLLGLGLAAARRRLRWRSR